MKERLHLVLSIAAELSAAIFFILFARTLQFIFWLTDTLGRKRKQNGKHRKIY